MHQQPARFGGGKLPGNDADFRVLHMCRQSVRAEDIRIAGQRRIGTFDVHLHPGLRAERAGDDVPRLPQHRFFGLHPTRADHLPLQTVIEGELFDTVPADTIGAAVAHMTNHHAAGRQGKSRTGGAHPRKIVILRATFMDVGIRLLDCIAERLRLLVRPRFEPCVGNGVGRDLAGQLAHGMTAHPIGHQKQVAVVLPRLPIRADVDAAAVFIVAAAESNIAQRGILDGLVPTHERSCSAAGQK